MTVAKPAIVLVPGAWHVARHYQLLTSRLEAAGYEVHALDLPSTEDATIPDAWKEDIKLISRTVEQLADEGRDVLLVLHSRGGLAGSDAAEGMSTTDRAKQGKQGGIVGIVYICAFASPEGHSIDQAVQGKHTNMEIDGTRCRPVKVHDNFYTDLSADVAQEQAKHLREMHVTFFHHRVKYAAWKHIPSTYLFCENDKALPPGGQEAMIAQPGANFTVERCGASHSPFLSMPDFTAEVVRRAAGEQV
ncbi:hypothetical protein LTR08_005823 [Meristemomyces frigidus]|nr:hypothetical protein LTR08_005823 [Meristemomyces frigidus]